jgi:arsenite methyltransferase
MESNTREHGTGCCGGTATTAKSADSCCGPADGAGAAAVGSEIKESVKARYGGAAKEAARKGSSCCGGGGKDPITADLYDAAETAGLPEEAVLASLGCGNPTLLAELREGERVLDLGSGGGIDVLLSARRVGPAGMAYGVDMTDEMLELARENQRRAGVTNVEFLRGDIENIPLPEASVDVVISNCVINLAADKGAALREAYRVLAPGGRFAVSDIVRRREIPEAIARSVELWIGCIAGALSEEEYRRHLSAAGFVEVEIVPTRIYTLEDGRQLLAESGIAAEDVEAADGAFMSAFVRATKPA